MLQPGDDVMTIDLGGPGATAGQAAYTQIAFAAVSTRANTERVIAKRTCTV